MSQEQAEDAARQFKALADPGRLRALSLVMASPDGEASTTDLTEALGLSQPTVSHHLKKLAAAGLITGEKWGVWTYYRAEREALLAASRCLAPAPIPPIDSPPK